MFTLLASVPIADAPRVFAGHAKVLPPVASCVIRSQITCPMVPLMMVGNPAFPVRVIAKLSLSEASKTGDPAAKATVRVPGKSAGTMRRATTAPGEPDAGPAKKVFALSLAKLIVSVMVPELVMGLPLTLPESSELRESATATLVTVPVPTTPAAVSTSVNNLKVGAAAGPLSGPAHTVKMFSTALLIARVPLPVTGDPLTVNSGGAVSPTLVTVPDPAPAPTIKISGIVICG